MVPETRTPVSIEEFWHLAHCLPKAELVAGQVIELVPPGARHGFLVAALIQRLREHVAVHDLGIVLADAGFVLSTDPPTVRAPDISVVLRARVPSPLPVKFFSGPPDLAVEVLSPDDRPAEVAAKLADCLRAGAQGVWVIDPEAQTATVHTRQGTITYRLDETLRGAPPLPDFTLPLPDLFPAFL
jgi:Uma2 family endonuclease